MLLSNIIIVGWSNHAQRNVKFEARAGDVSYFRVRSVGWREATVRGKGTAATRLRLGRISLRYAEFLCDFCVMRRCLAFQ
jgi:hypothetical protein